MSTERQREDMIKFSLIVDRRGESIRISCCGMNLPRAGDCVRIRRRGGGGTVVRVESVEWQLFEPLVTSGAHMTDPAVHCTIVSEAGTEGE